MHDIHIGRQVFEANYDLDIFDITPLDNHAQLPPCSPSLIDTPIIVRTNKK